MITLLQHSRITLTIHVVYMLDYSTRLQDVLVFLYTVHAHSG